MKPFKYQRLLVALLLEATSGYYREGMRFLSYRKICERWSVSQATAESALDAMVRSGILRIKPRAGYLFMPRGRSVALRQLQRFTIYPLPPARPDWVVRRAGLRLHRERRQKIAMVLDVGHHAGSQQPTPASIQNDERAFYCYEVCAERAREKGCEVELYCGIADHPGFSDIAEQLHEQEIDGIIFFRRRSIRPTKTLFDQLSGGRVPVISVFNECRGSDAFVIDFNNIAAGHDAARHFWNVGLSRFAVMHPGTRQPNYLDRVEGFRLGLVECGAPPDALTVLRGKRFKDNKRFEQWLRQARQTPSALFLIAHYPLNELIPLLHRFRLGMPGHLSVIMTSSNASFPSIQRKFDIMHLDFHAVGMQAVDLLLEILDGRPVSKSTLVPLPYHAFGTTRAVDPC